MTEQKPEGIVLTREEQYKRLLERMAGNKHLKILREMRVNKSDLISVATGVGSPSEFNRQWQEICAAQKAIGTILAQLKRDGHGFAQEALCRTLTQDIPLPGENEPITDRISITLFLTQADKYLAIMRDSYYLRPRVDPDPEKTRVKIASQVPAEMILGTGILYPCHHKPKVTEQQHFDANWFEPLKGFFLSDHPISEILRLFERDIQDNIAFWTFNLPLYYWKYLCQSGKIFKKAIFSPTVQRRPSDIEYLKSHFLPWDGYDFEALVPLFYSSLSPWVKNDKFAFVVSLGSAEAFESYQNRYLGNGFDWRFIGELTIS
jgi:hypothetical protein